MLRAVLRRAPHLSVAVAGLVLFAFGGLGLVRAATTPAIQQQYCEGLLEAQAVLTQAATLPDLPPEVADALDVILEGLQVSMNLEASGRLQQALTLERDISLALEAMVSETNEMQAGELRALLSDALDAMAVCLDRGIMQPPPTPSPTPTPPPPPPILIYSARFVCGTETAEVGTVMPGLGEDTRQPAQTRYRTDISIQNFGLSAATVKSRVVQANPIGTAKGKMSDIVSEVLEPGEAMRVDCDNIQDLMGPTPVACPDEREARRVLASLLERPVSWDMTPYVDVATMIELIDTAIRFEEAGRQQDSLMPQKESLALMDYVIGLAREGRSSPAAAAIIAQARELLQGCVEAAESPESSQAALRLSTRSALEARLIEGFVVIETESALEVTASYWARTTNVNSSGEVNSGLSIEVFQVQPHEVHRPPSPGPASLGASL